MLGILDNVQKVNWKKYINILVYVYNFIRYDIIGFILFYLMFGRELVLLVDVVFGFFSSYFEDKCIIKYIFELK